MPSSTATHRTTDLVRQEGAAVGAGLASGLVQAAMFSPLDRALFLSVMHTRNLLHVDNWRHPWQGIAQAITHRTLACGLYYILQDNMQLVFNPLFGMSAFVFDISFFQQASCFLTQRATTPRPSLLA